jgi:hypothetical protein
VTALGPRLGIQSPAEHWKCAIIQQKCFYLPFVNQSNPNIKVHEIIFTFHLTVVKPGLATSRANLIVLSVDMKLTTANANRVTVLEVRIA